MQEEIRDEVSWFHWVGAGAVLLSVETHFLAREFLDALQECGVVFALTNTRGCRREHGLEYAIFAADRGAQLNLRLAGESVLYFRG
jgi:hypothetical protein